MLGAEFKYRYQDVHDTTQRIIEWVPGKKVVWHVVDSHINFVKDRTEWNGTDIVFEIDRSRARPNSALRTSAWFLPSNATAAVQSAWGFYINDSLRSLITTGKGQPNLTEEAALFSE